MARQDDSGARSGRGRHRASSANGRSAPAGRRGPRATESTASAGKVDRRIDERRKEVTRARRRKWWIGFLALLGMALVVIAGWALLHSSLFSVRSMRVDGATPLVHDEVLSASGITTGVPLVSIDTAAAATSINAIPLIKNASVQLRWPSSVQITVTMRTPVAFVPVGAKYARIDPTGRVLARLVNPPTKFTLKPLEMQLIGITPGKPGSWLPDRAGAAIKVATRIPPAFRDQVAKVIGNADGTVTLQMTAPVTIALGTAEKLGAKFSDIAAIIAGTSLHAGDVVDVSVPQASTITRGVG